jgi:hypothetical protein
MGFLSAIFGALQEAVAWFFVQIWYVIAALLKFIMNLVGWAATKVPYPQGDNGVPVLYADSSGEMTDIWNGLATAYNGGGGAGATDGVGIRQLVYFLLLLGGVLFMFSRTLDESLPNDLLRVELSASQVFWYFIIALLWWPLGTLMAFFAQMLTNIFVCFGIGVVADMGTGVSAGSSCSGTNFFGAAPAQELFKQSITMVSQALSNDPSFFLALLAIMVGIGEAFILIFASLLWMMRIWILYILFMVMPIVIMLRPFKVLPGLGVLGELGSKTINIYTQLLFLSIPGAILAAIGAAVTAGFTSSFCGSATPDGGINSPDSADVTGFSGGGFNSQQVVSNPLSSFDSAMTSQGANNPVLISQGQKGMTLVQTSGPGCSGSSLSAKLMTVFGGLTLPLLVALGPWILAAVANKAGVTGGFSDPIGMSDKLDPKTMKQRTEDRYDQAKDYYGEARDKAESVNRTQREFRAGLDAGVDDVERHMEDEYGYDYDEDDKLLAGTVGAGLGSGSRSVKEAAKEGGTSLEKGILKAKEDPGGTVKGIGEGIESRASELRDRSGEKVNAIEENLRKTPGRTKEALYDAAEESKDKALETFEGSWADRRYQAFDNAEEYALSGNEDVLGGELSEDEINDASENTDLMDTMSVLDRPDIAKEKFGEGLSIGTDDDSMQTLSAAAAGMEGLTEDEAKSSMRRILSDAGAGEEEMDKFEDDWRDEVETNDYGEVESMGGLVDAINEMEDERDLDIKSDRVVREHAKSKVDSEQVEERGYESKEEFVREEVNLDQASEELLSSDAFDVSEAIENNLDSELANYAKELANEQGDITKDAIDDMIEKQNEIIEEAFGSMEEYQNANEGERRQQLESIQDELDLGEAEIDLTASGNLEDKIEEIQSLSSDGPLSQDQIEAIGEEISEQSIELSSDLDDMGLEVSSTDDLTEELANQTEVQVNEALNEAKSEQVAQQGYREAVGGLSEDGSMEFDELADALDLEGQFEDGLKSAIEGVEGMSVEVEGDSEMITTDEFMGNDEIMEAADDFFDNLQKSVESAQQSGDINVTADVDIENEISDMFDSDVIREAINEDGSVDREFLKENADTARDADRLNDLDEIKDEIKEAASDEAETTTEDVQEKYMEELADVEPGEEYGSNY